MRFLHAAQLAWLALLAVPVVLYLFRRKPRDVRVSTLLFFKTLAREFQESAWLRWLKRILSFLLSAAVIVFAALALARLVVSPPAGALKGVVMLVDRSASMAARDEGGRTRLDDARSGLREGLAGLPGGVAVSVMAYDRRPEILLPRSLDRREVERALASITVRPVEGDAASALALARQLASIEAPAAIWHATDNDLHHQGTKNTKDDDDTEDPSGRASAPLGDLGALVVKDVSVPLASPVNAGLTAFQLRRLPMERGRLEAFVQVHYTGKEPAEVQLEMRVDGALVSLRSLTVEPGGRERLLVPLEAGEGRALSLRVKAKGDSLPLDDEVHAVIPELRPVKVLWVTPEPNPFTELALGSLAAATEATEGKTGARSGGENAGEIEVYRGGPDVWPPSEPVDVVIFEDWLPDEWPAAVPVVAVNPPKALGPVMVAPLRSDGLPLDGVRATRERHPVLYGVATGRVAVTQTAVLDPDGPLEPLWVGEAGAVLAAGEVRGQRVVVMGFDPERSERLPLMASYPLLMGNAIYWASEPAAGAGSGARLSTDTANRRTGELVRLEGRTITWSVPSAAETSEETVPVVGRWVELDRAGLWRTDAGETGSAALLSAKETLLPCRAGASGLGAGPAAGDKVRGDEGRGGEEGEVASRGGKGGFLGGVFRGDLAPTMIWLVLAVLAVESYLFHRKAVY